MTAWDLPPPRIPVAEFFERWLPEAFRASGSRPPPDAPVVRASISGEGGGSWDVRAEDDGLRVERSDRNPPGVWLRQSVVDLRAALGGDADLPALIPPKWTALDLLFLDPRDVDLLRRVSGRVAVEVSGRRGRRWAFDVAFGKAGLAAGRPRATIRVDGPTYAGVLGGTIPPMQPLVDGRIRLGGDRSLAMQILVLLGARLARPASGPAKRGSR